VSGNSEKTINREASATAALSKPSGGAPAHKHCPVCGISISTSKNYCGVEHEEADEKAQRRMKNFRTITLLLMVSAMVALVGVSIFLRAHA
jgi:predicted nucleic acid-binding Zn ribbon protein